VNYLSVVVVVIRELFILFIPRNSKVQALQWSFLPNSNKTTKR
jgi:hypothetical protein